jgi:GT2 family glycosyltransferase
VIALERNVGIAARNRAARAANGDLLLMLDDDSYPTEHAVERMRQVLVRDGRVAVVGGLVRELMPAGRVVATEPGSFDWFLRAGDEGEPPPGGFPTFFFPEGACLLRRDAFLEAGGFFEPFFFASVEIDLATRLIQNGWDVRYLPTATFDHMRQESRVFGFHDVLRYRIRNHLWYVWLRFPVAIAMRRTAAYLAFDLIEALYRRAPGAWLRGIADAWTQRHRVRGERHPLDRAVLRRAELTRGRLHLRLLFEMLRKRLPGGRRARVEDPVRSATPTAPGSPAPVTERSGPTRK